LLQRYTQRATKAIIEVVPESNAIVRDEVMMRVTSQVLQVLRFLSAESDRAMKQQRKEMIKKEEKIAKGKEVKEYKRTWQGTGERDEIAFDNTIMDAIPEFYVQAVLVDRRQNIFSLKQSNAKFAWKFWMKK
jgi:hypothetical protein